METTTGEEVFTVIVPVIATRVSRLIFADADVLVAFPLLNLAPELKKTWDFCEKKMGRTRWGRGDVVLLQLLQQQSMTIICLYPSTC
jgi:hypothetical protein